MIPLLWRKEVGEKMKKRKEYNGSLRWSPKEIAREKKRVEEIRKIFTSREITGEEASKIILEMRHGKEE